MLKLNTVVGLLSVVSVVCVLCWPGRSPHSVGNNAGPAGDYLSLPEMIQKFEKGEWTSGSKNEMSRGGEPWMVHGHSNEDGSYLMCMWVEGKQVLTVYLFNQTLYAAHLCDKTRSLDREVWFFCDAQKLGVHAELSRKSDARWKERYEKEDAAEKVEQEKRRLKRLELEKQWKEKHGTPVEGAPKAPK